MAWIDQLKNLVTAHPYVALGGGALGAFVIYKHFAGASAGTTAADSAGTTAADSAGLSDVLDTGISASTGGIPFPPGPVTNLPPAPQAPPRPPAPIKTILPPAGQVPPPGGTVPPIKRRPGIGSGIGSGHPAFHSTLDVMADEYDYEPHAADIYN